MCVVRKCFLLRSPPPKSTLLFVLADGRGSAATSGHAHKLLRTVPESSGSKCSGSKPEVEMSLLSGCIDPVGRMSHIFQPALTHHPRRRLRVVSGMSRGRVPCSADTAASDGKKSTAILVSYRQSSLPIGSCRVLVL